MELVSGRTFITPAQGHSGMPQGHSADMDDCVATSPIIPVVKCDDMWKSIQMLSHKKASHAEEDRKESQDSDVKALKMLEHRLRSPGKAIQNEVDRVRSPGKDSDTLENKRRSPKKVSLKDEYSLRSPVKSLLRQKEDTLQKEDEKLLKEGKLQKDADDLKSPMKSSQKKNCLKSRTPRSSNKTTEEEETIGCHTLRARTKSESETEGGTPRKRNSRLSLATAEDSESVGESRVCTRSRALKMGTPSGHQKSPLKSGQTRNKKTPDSSPSSITSSLRKSHTSFSPVVCSMCDNHE